MKHHAEGQMHKALGLQIMNQLVGIYHLIDYEGMEPVAF